MDPKIPIRISMGKRPGTTKRTLRHQRIVSYLESVKVAKTLSEITDHLNSRSEGRVSRKTVERDILDLTDQYQITQTPGRPAGFRIPEDAPREYRLELDDGDLQSLTLAICILKSESPEVFEELTEMLEAKILHKLPSRLRKELDRLSKLCVARGAPSGRTRGAKREDVLSLLLALRQGRAVNFNYDSPYKEKEGLRERKFGLATVEVFGGSFYMLGEDLEISKDEGSRIKRISFARVRNVRVLDEAYTAPSLSQLTKWEGSFAGLGGDKQEPRKIRLRCGKNLGTYLMEHEIHPSQTIAKTSKDGFEVEFLLPAGSPFLRFLAGFAWDISSLEPKDVKEELAELLESGMKAIG